ncbi:MGH1-like glycoside hydrolase domain-containing protein [Nesterenkonia sandarakina]|uniref:Mannosylglycerate hydrolase MGH1-like glycoside hydrolase domain-containing protein n=1 Tax=Nesterenkonia sandarakina TaxID=272918 RepID=A0A2T0YNQ3_9MICC|nr:hypothetical protein [Nesterenkonia sandarakina]PRZ16759.1 hypothetical protein BCL67_10679 [Nesterenkonia sandarakina]
MTAIDDALVRLRTAAPAPMKAGLTGVLAGQLGSSGVGFAALGGPLEDRWHQALTELEQCIRPLGDSMPVLNEGGVYAGSWIESTGTINTEVLSRLAPRTAKETFALFARHQRGDGLIPYKVTADGPGFSQIQIVTPLARSVWNHYELHRGTEDADHGWLRLMYQAMVRYDAWLATNRDTRGTGCVEAFCTFDTGHDLSPRFWFAPERCLHGDAAQCDPEAALVPYLAPDLTANVACQRRYLAKIAGELGEDADSWEDKARASVKALFEQCYDEQDGTFYDVDSQGNRVRVVSDVLMRVLASEIGDAEFFAVALQRYILNTAHFLSHYGFTSVSISDPRFDGDHTRNSWAGPVNFLTQIRAPHAFEHHGRSAELATVTRPLLGALALADRFPQCIDPWSGSAGFTTAYSPAILWLLDTVERSCGIEPRPDGTLSFTSLAPTRLDHGAAADATAYSRTVAGAHYELAADDHQTLVCRDAQEHMRFPRGWRVITDRGGLPTQVIGMTTSAARGTLSAGGKTLELSLDPNERVELVDLEVSARHTPGYTPPRAG